MLNWLTQRINCHVYYAPSTIQHSLKCRLAEELLVEQMPLNQLNRKFTLPCNNHNLQGMYTTKCVYF